jgi:uncharacterized membrane protein YedE/YeeE
MRMWMLAIAVAILGTHAMHLSGLIDLTKSFYVRPNVTWLSYILGGLLFGIGMTLGSGCGARRWCGWRRKPKVGGRLRVLRHRRLHDAQGAVRDLAHDLDRPGGVRPLGPGRGAAGLARPSCPRRQASPRVRSRWWLPGVLAVALLAFVFKDRDFRASFDHVLGGTVVGLTIVGGWYVTGHLGFAENPETLEDTFFGTNSRTIESLSYTAPVGFTLELLMLWSDRSLTVTFGIAAVVGIVLGSFAYALASRTFRWEGLRGPRTPANHVIGGMLMGFGGVTALGCTVGQGLSGSRRSRRVALAFAAIVAGSAPR